MGFQYLETSLKAPEVVENDKNLSVLDIFKFPNTFFVLKVKYYHIRLISVEIMQEVEHLLKIPKLIFKTL